MDTGVYQRVFRPNPRYRQREHVPFTKTVVIEDRAHHVQGKKIQKAKGWNESLPWLVKL